MIANPDKFKAVILTKYRKDNSNLELNFCDKKIKTSDKVQLLRITIDQRLSFEQHISEICRKASGQLNALKRLGSYLPVEAHQPAVDAFILANYNYCPVVWYFSTSKQMQKIERIQERALRFIVNDYKLDYQYLLVESNNVTMEVKRMRSLCIEVFKTLNGLNPVYMSDIFKSNNSSYSSRRPYDLKIPRVNQTAFGPKSIKYEGARLWNHLPNTIKSAENLITFKRLIKAWQGPNCKCSFCKHVSKN